jgi:hypothetical protein
MNLVWRPAMARFKPFAWLALVLPVVLWCAAPVLVIAGAATLSALGGVLTGSLVVAAAVVVAGAGAAGVVLCRRHRRGSPATCCAVPPALTIPTAEEAPVASGRNGVP